MKFCYYIGEGPEAEDFLAEMRRRSETVRSARTKLMDEYGADALISSRWSRGKPAGLGFKKEQNAPYLKRGEKHDDVFAYYPKRNTKAGKELAAKLSVPELEFDASDYIINSLKLSRMVVGRCSGSRTGMAMYYSSAGCYGSKVLVKIPGNSGLDCDPMPEIPSWFRPCKESEFLAAQGL